MGSEVQILPGPPFLAAGVDRRGFFSWVIGDVAQLGEHLLCKQGVVGSIPIVSTRYGWCVGLVLSRRSVGFGSECVVCREVTGFLGSLALLLRGAFFGSVNQVLVRLWACLVATSDRWGDPSATGQAFRGVKCCVLSESLCVQVLFLRTAGRKSGGCWGWFLCMEMELPSGGSEVLEREKGIRWMPWHQEAMKDVARCEKPRGAASRR